MVSKFRKHKNEKQETKPVIQSSLLGRELRPMETVQRDQKASYLHYPSSHVCPVLFAYSIYRVKVFASKKMKDKKKEIGIRGA
jgi:hypothetical protein